MEFSPEQQKLLAQSFTSIDEAYKWAGRNRDDMKFVFGDWFDERFIPLPGSVTITIPKGWRSWVTSTAIPPRERFAELPWARRRAVKKWGILRERIRSLQAQVRKDIMMEVYEEEQMKKRKKVEHRHFKRNIAAGVFFSNWALILSLLWVNIQ